MSPKTLRMRFLAVTLPAAFAPAVVGAIWVAMCSCLAPCQIRSGLAAGWSLQIRQNDEGCGLPALGNHTAASCRPSGRSEEHTSELQSLMRISYAVFCLKKKTKHNNKYLTRKNS